MVCCCLIVCNSDQVLFLILVIAYLIYLYLNSEKHQKHKHARAKESLMKKIKKFEDKELKSWGIKQF